MKFYSTKGIQQKMPFSLQMMCLELVIKRKQEGGIDYFHSFELSVTKEGN